MYGTCFKIALRIFLNCYPFSFSFGGQFLVPYTFFMITVGYPVHYMESCLGQYYQQGPIRIWDCLPFSRGIGFSMFFLSIIVAFYCSMYASYAVIYFAQCFRRVLPWQYCPSYGLMNNTCVPKMCGYKNSSQTIAAEYYHLVHILGFDPKLSNNVSLSDYFGPLITSAILGLFLTWVIVYVATIQSVKSIGRIVFLLIVLPYFCLFLMFAAGIKLPGSLKGFDHLISNFRDLLHWDIWRQAAQQVLFELGLGQGIVLTYASYCQHHNKPHIESLVVCGVSYFTSILSGLTALLYYGAVANELGTSVTTIVKHSTGGLFVVYPEAVSRIFGSQLWCMIVFCMVYCTVLALIIGSVETITTVMYDEFCVLLRYRGLANFVVCLVLFSLGFIFCTSSGGGLVYVFHVFPGCVARLVITICFIISIVYLYTFKKFSADVYFMTAYEPSIALRICTRIVPFVLLVLVLLSWIMFESCKFSWYRYDRALFTVMWFIIGFVLIWIVLLSMYWTIYCLSMKKCRKIFKPLDEFYLDELKQQGGDIISINNIR